MDDETESIYDASLEVGERRLAELRAILAPLLNNPVPAPIQRCVFCERYPWFHESQLHTPDCPVLRRDELLGRTAAPPTPSG